MLATQEYEMEIQYNSTCRDLIKKGISHPCFYGDIIKVPQRMNYDHQIIALQIRFFNDFTSVDVSGLNFLTLLIISP
jgi:hypothetical protein